MRKKLDGGRARSHEDSDSNFESISSNKNAVKPGGTDTKLRLEMVSIHSEVATLILGVVAGLCKIDWFRFGRTC